MNFANATNQGLTPMPVRSAPPANTPPGSQSATVGPGQTRTALAQGKEPIGEGTLMPNADATHQLPPIPLMLELMKSVNTTADLSMNKLWTAFESPLQAHEYLLEALGQAARFSQAQWHVAFLTMDTWMETAPDLSAVTGSSAHETRDVRANVVRHQKHHASLQQQMWNVFQASIHHAHLAHRLYRFTAEASICAKLSSSARASGEAYLQSLSVHWQKTIQLVETALGLMGQHHAVSVQLDRHVSRFTRPDGNDDSSTHGANHLELYTAASPFAHAVFNEVRAICQRPKEVVDTIYTNATQQKSQDAAGFCLSQRNSRVAYHVILSDAAQLGERPLSDPTCEADFLKMIDSNVHDGHRLDDKTKSTPFAGLRELLAGFGATLCYFFEARLLRDDALLSENELVRSAGDPLTMLMDAYENTCALFEQRHTEDTTQVKAGNVPPTKR